MAWQSLYLRLVPIIIYLLPFTYIRVKMSLTTPDEDYVAEDAALLLGEVGQQEVRRASEDLLSRGVIAEVGNTHRKTPGRKLKISDLWV
jgi:oxalate---CoA ligase